MIWQYLHDKSATIYNVYTHMQIQILMQKVLDSAFDKNYESSVTVLPPHFQPWASDHPHQPDHQEHPEHPKHPNHDHDHDIDH